MNKTILITGSTDGIGKIAATKLAQDGHQVIIHGRNPEKLEKTRLEIIAQTSNNNITAYRCDLSDFEDVKRFAQDLNNNLGKLDVLINNAGVFKSGNAKNSNGLDLRIAVNYFAPYLLTKKLLPLLEKTKHSRIVNLSSAAQASVSMKALVGEEDLSEQGSYAQSKLALTMWSFDLAKKRPNINTIAVNPGSLLNTKMVQEAYGKHWAPADKGANILYDLALSSDYENDSGKYFDNDKSEQKGFFAPAHSDAYDQAKIEKLITATERILGL